MLLSLFITGIIGAAQSENDTGIIIPRFCDRSNTFSTFSLSKYGTGQGLKKEVSAVGSTVNQARNPCRVPSRL